MLRRTFLSALFSAQVPQSILGPGLIPVEMQPPGTVDIRALIDALPPEGGVIRLDPGVVLWRPRTRN